jgi:acyl-CoA thioester hydrolase
VSGAAQPPSQASAGGGPAQSSRILVYELQIPIRWGDMDAMGHVNNTVYFRYFEQTRISWFESLGFGPDPQGQGPVIVNASCTFIRQFEYPGTVLTRHYVGELGRSSFQTYVDMFRTDLPGVLHAQGAAKVVWVDFTRQKSVTLPQEMRETLVRPWQPQAV